MCRALNYPRSTYYDKQREKLENRWKSVSRLYSNFNCYKGALIETKRINGQVIFMSKIFTIS